MAKKSILPDVIESSPNRRKFVQLFSAAGAAAAVVASTGQANAQTITDTDILNFALNLEYLEAEFYTVATTGQTIDKLGIGITGVGTEGPTSGGKQVPLNNSLVFTQRIALEIADDERKHVQFLRAVLGSNAIAKPEINLNALGAGFNGQADFLQVARALEDVGVTAYAGAAPLITSKEVLGHAARILGTEAEHAGNIRLQVARYNLPASALDGVDILPPPSGTKFFSVTNDTAEVQVRTPGQVLYIVYGSKANVTMGGFFPTGVNGNIKTSSAGA
jgi:hypothetical protein